MTMFPPTARDGDWLHLATLVLVSFSSFARFLWTFDRLKITFQTITINKLKMESDLEVETLGDLFNSPISPMNVASPLSLYEKGPKRPT